MKSLNLVSHLKYQAKTLIDILQQQAKYQPDSTAYIFLQDGETEEIRLTYQELEYRAQSIAVQLQELGSVGERALLLYPSGLEFICAFLGCLYAGIVAVPAYPPRRNQHMARVQAIIDDAQATFVLTTTSVFTNLKSLLTEQSELEALRWIVTDSINSNLGQHWRKPMVKDDSLAFLQYTSGSTGTPKGVMVSHGNLLHNQQMIQQAFGHSSKTIFVSWLPLFHDMGLIGNVLQPLYLGIPSILLSPEAFLMKPWRWLRAISHYKATTSGGPNFAYDLCVRKITPEQRASLDLSSWDVAFNGAEPIRWSTIEQFTQTFADCGFTKRAFYPCYGMAETTLLVSGGIKSNLPIVCSAKEAELEKNRVIIASIEDDEGVRKIVGCGQAWLDEKIVIVDPDSLIECSPGQVGEIWVASGSVANGYWQRAQETQKTFQAYIADTREGPFLRTGDLGFLQDGELFVTGRLKDLIIIRGRNHYPQDIELTVETSHPAVRPNCGAAFTITAEGEEKLVITYEIERSYLRKLNAQQVIGAIRQAIAQTHELEVYGVLLLKTASVPKTSSGKIQRSGCRSGFLTGGLDVVASWSMDSLEKQVTVPQQQLPQNELNQQLEHSREAIQTWLISKVAQQLQVTPSEIDIRQPLAQYGLSSMVAISLAGEIQQWLGRDISPTLLYDYPTLELLAQHLAGKTTASFVEIQDSPALLKTEAIAIIGLGCRFPGADNPKAFWQLLQKGVDAITEVPASRWDLDDLYNSESTTPGKMSSRWGGFLQQVDQFDPYFFGIAPREAESMDPQQRLLLEVAWETLENAGQAPQNLAGSQTGVFIGISNNDYLRLQSREYISIDAYTGTGNALSLAANRLSYVLDLRGPSLAVDTACSSSLVAVHLACQSLQNRECHQALAGGVNLILSPELTLIFSHAQMMANDGRCKTFDAAADGYVRGEGCGLVLLKRLSDAQADGDNILAVIRGSAINQDGRSNGLTAPNGLAQQAVIHQALSNAGVAASEISYVETHGTGTALGDPIEVESLKAVLSVDRPAEQTCVLGSVKANIGHLEAAAGIAGLIKVVLSLQHEEIPSQLHLKQLNPHISLDQNLFHIPQQKQPWLRTSQPRFAGVSSFGFGGTNAHVVLEEAPQTSQTPAIFDRPLHLLTLSAKQPEALVEIASSYEKHLALHPAINLEDICFTTNAGRTHFEHRLTIITESTQQLCAQLQAFVRKSSSTGILQGQVSNHQSPKIAFLFTGQGSQYIGMGQQLYNTQPIFRQALDHCDQILRPYLEQPLISVLYPPSGEKSPLDETIYTQPALFALEYALCELWQSWGIKPSIVMGHSVGEYVAAVVAGVFSLEDGLKLIANRGKLMHSLPQDGEMVAVRASESQVQSIIQPYSQQVSLAAINSPANVVISGQRQAVQVVCASLEAQGIKTTPLRVSHAFHSPLMEPILQEFEQIAQEVKYHSPRIKIISNLTGQIVTKEITTPEYWCHHLRQPVQFATGMATLQQQGYTAFVEIGGKPTLLAMVRQCLVNYITPETPLQLLPSLQPEKADWQQLLESVSALYIHGVNVDWLKFDHDYQRRKVELPTYPFQRQHCWYKTPKNSREIQKSVATNGNQTTIINLLEQLLESENTAQISTGELKRLPQLIDLLVKKYQTQVNPILDWFYQVEWLAKPKRTTPETLKQPGTSSWVIFADQTGVGQALAKLLQQHGEECFIVYMGESYQNYASKSFCLHPSHPKNYESLCQELVKTIEKPLKGIIHLWNLETQLLNELNLSSLEKAQKWGCESVLYLVQAIVKHESLGSGKLWVVTRGVQAIKSSPNPLAVAQSTVWGLGKVIAFEYPQLWGGMVDLAGETSTDEVTQLLAEIEQADAENQLALREQECYVARLVPSQLLASPTVELKSDKSYLITGGLGALGLRVAQWMAKQGAKFLVLSGRSRPDEQKQKVLQELNAAGVKVLVVHSDVSQPEDLSQALREIATAMPPLSGIIHAAGVLNDGTLLQQNWQRFTQVMLPKVQGTWNLHLLTKDLPLDFFIVFSSVASLLGSPGQGNYASANAFMDTLMAHRLSLGLPGLSIHWGPWENLGMTSHIGSLHQSRLNHQGFKTISQEQGLQALEKLLGSQTQGQIAVIPFVWSTLQQQRITDQLPLLASLIPTKELEESSAKTTPEQTEILQQLEQAIPSDRQKLLINHIQVEVAQILGMQPSKLPDPQQRFFEMGMDSLTAIELKNRLAKNLNCSLPATLGLEVSTIKDMAEYLLKEILHWQTQPLSDNKLVPDEDLFDETLSRVEKLSDDRVNQSIAEELAKLENLLKDN